jgi:hypothetical protein
MRLSVHVLLVAILLVLGLLPLESRAANPPVDPAATEILKRMTDYLGSLEQFSVHTQNTLEDLISSNHRIDLDVSAKVIVSRPNKIRSERKGDKIDQIFYYNGKNLTLFNPGSNAYSTLEAPDSFYGLFKFLYESLGFGLPISDLILSDAFPLLMQDVTLAQAVGKTYIDGVRCDHLLFSRPGVDFQVWVNEGSKPLPLKYVVTDTATSSRLSITTRMNDWDVYPIVDISQFTFVQPEGAQSIKFIQF